MSIFTNSTTSSATLCERRTARGHCAADDDCHGVPVLRLYVAVRPEAHIGDEVVAEYSTPHHVCREHREDGAVALSDALRHAEIGLIWNRAHEEIGLQTGRLLMVARYIK